MNPFLMAYANSYLDGKKLYPDTPAFVPEPPPADDGGFAFGGQSMGQTASQAPAPAPAPAPKPVDNGSFTIGRGSMGMTPTPVKTGAGDVENYMSSTGATPAPSGMLTSGFAYGGQSAGQTAADAKDQYGFSQKQYGDIKANWDAVKTDPAQMMKLMTDYGVDAAALSRATGVSYDEIGNYLKTNGAANGFGGYSWQEPASAPAQGGFVVGGGNATTTPTTPAPAPSAPVAQAPTGVETAERRISGLLGVDQYGNYTNQVVRQAADRALQAFAGRGLLNSSMAQQAAQEAAISKATEIATTDAGFINADLQKDKDRQFQSEQERIAFERQLEQLAIQNGYDIDKLREQYGLETAESDKRDNKTNEWNLQSSYRTQRQQVDVNYNNTVNNINVSQMTPEQKQAAIAAAAETRDAEAATLNEVYARAPSWKNEWSTVAVLTSESGIKNITSVPRLSSIINDPAQPESMRAAARARIAELRTAAPATPATQPATTGQDGLINNMRSGNND